MRIGSNAFAIALFAAASVGSAIPHYTQIAEDSAGDIFVALDRRGGSSAFKFSFDGVRLGGVYFDTYDRYERVGFLKNLGGRHVFSLANEAGFHYFRTLNSDLSFSGGEAMPLINSTGRVQRVRGGYVGFENTAGFAT